MQDVANMKKRRVSVKNWRAPTASVYLDWISTSLLEHLEMRCSFPVGLMCFVHAVCGVECGQHALCKHLQNHQLCIIYRGLVQLKQLINLAALGFVASSEQASHAGRAKKTKNLLLTQFDVSARTRTAAEKSAR